MKSFLAFLIEMMPGLITRNPSQAEIKRELLKGNQLRYLTFRGDPYIANALDTYHGDMADNIGVVQVPRKKGSPLSGWLPNTLTGFVNPEDLAPIQKDGFKRWIARRHLAAKHDKTNEYHGRYIRDPHEYDNDR